MRLPRDLTGAELIRHLVNLGYQKTRQTGSHVRLTCDVPYQHHVTVSLHDPLRDGRGLKPFLRPRRLYARQYSAPSFEMSED
ncbi:MAG: type II toxin-antitoxin system HicA family toxin [Burkholderiales bacterium]